MRAPLAKRQITTENRETNRCESAGNCNQQKGLTVSASAMAEH
jgi:hypothetical protein